MDWRRTGATRLRRFQPRMLLGRSEVAGGRRDDRSSASPNDSISVVELSPTHRRPTPSRGSPSAPRRDDPAPDRRAGGPPFAPRTGHRLRPRAPAQAEEIAQARCRLQKGRTNVAVGAQHRLAALPQRHGVEAEGAPKSVLAHAAEEGRQRFVLQRRPGFVVQGILAPLAAPEDERCPVAADDLGPDPQLLPREPVGVRRPLRDAVEQRADRRERRRLSRLVRAVDDMKPASGRKVRRRLSKAPNFSSSSVRIRMQSFRLGAGERQRLRVGQNRFEFERLPLRRRGPGSLAGPSPIIASTARSAGSCALSSSEAARSIPAGAGPSVRRGAAVATRTCSSQTASPQRCAAASVLSRRSASARRRACSDVAPVRVTRTASILPSAASACGRTCASMARSRLGSSS